MSRLRSRLAAAALVAALAGSLVACSTPTVSTSAGPTASAAPSAGSALSPSEFAAALKRPGTVVLDVRTPAEFAQGHLPGAVNADVESTDFAATLATLDPTAAYAVYCRSGNRSKVALTAMLQAGFDEVFHLEGGITAWTAAGGDTTTG